MLTKTWGSLPPALSRLPHLWPAAVHAPLAQAGAGGQTAGVILLATLTRAPNSADRDTALLDGARRLDARALGEIHDTSYPAIYRYAHYRLGDGEAAADLAAEVFLRLLDALHANRPPQNTLRGWLFGVAAHLVADHWRKRHGTGPLTDDIPDTQSVSAEAELNLQRSALRRALPRLTEEQQHVLALRFGEGFSVEESARILGKSVNAAKALQFRAVEALKRLLQEQA
jgi:RNA polymerase sigma-70 factor (ECF subfamily)